MIRRLGLAGKFRQFTLLLLRNKYHIIQINITQDQY